MKEIGKSVLGYDFRNEEAALFLGNEPATGQSGKNINSTSSADSGSDEEGHASL